MSLNFIPPQPPRPPRRISNPPSLLATMGIFVAALFLLLAVLNAPALAAAISYPFSHSTEKDNEQLTAEYRALYGYDHQLAAAAVTALPAPAGQGNELTIPKLGIAAPIESINRTDDATILNALKTGVVMYPGSSNPGEGGTTVIVGHSSSDLPWTAYSAIFANLDKLSANDIIYLTFNGREYANQVRTVQKGTAAELVNAGLSGDLVVSSCWPVGTDERRIAVAATLLHN